MSVSLASSTGLRFYREVARCIPFLMEQFECAELTTKSKLRRVVADRFRAHKDVKNPDTVDMLVYKGRQELEEIMKRYKNRHHVVNEWVLDPLEKERAKATKVDTGFSPFLEQFMESNYRKPQKC